MTYKPTGRPPGRPKAKIDPEQVRKMAAMGCTQEEIADVLGCDGSVICRRFAAEYTQARSSWKTSLRRAQSIRAIKDRSDPMLIHLGRNYLGQDAKDTPTMSHEELVAKIKARSTQLPTVPNGSSGETNGH
jgi:hypothetical protein